MRQAWGADEAASTGAADLSLKPEPVPVRTPAKVANEDEDEDRRLHTTTSGGLCAQCVNQLCRSCSNELVRNPSPSWSPPLNLRKTASTPVGRLPPTSPSNSHLKQLRMAELRNAELQKVRRVVTANVEADDLTATWGDQQMHGPDCDWRDCYVSDRTWESLSERRKRQVEKDRMRCLKAAVACYGDKVIVDARRAAWEALHRSNAAAGTGSVEPQATAVPCGNELREVAQQQWHNKLTHAERHEWIQTAANAMAEADTKSARGAEAAQRPSPCDYDEESHAMSKLAPNLSSLSKLSSCDTSRLSEGANGKVLRAQWKGSIKVAIKENLDPNVSIKDETHLFLDLKHPHIVACYGVLNEQQPDGVVKTSIVTERCTTSLDAFLKNHSRWQCAHGEPLSPDRIDFTKFTILHHVSQGLQRLHDMCVLHRDLKSLNILLDGEAGTCEKCDHAGTWKICDFGEAAILRTPELGFRPPQPWRGKLERGRFHPITSTHLNQAHAWHYAWLNPGETVPAVAEGQEIGPFKWGALVYSFNGHAGTDEESEKAARDADPTEWDERDCVFPLEGFPCSPTPCSSGTFPQALRPFNLVPTKELVVSQAPNTSEQVLSRQRSSATPRGRDVKCHRTRVTVDLSRSKYRIDLDTNFGSHVSCEQVKCLKDLYQNSSALSGGILSGGISRPCPIVSDEEATSAQSGEQRLEPETENETMTETETELAESQYLADLRQEESRPVAGPPWRCDVTGQEIGDGPNQTASLWLNLSDGFVGGGRRNPEWAIPYDGQGGNNTAIDHYEDMLKQGKQYPLAVKLDTITPRGADVHSYAEEKDVHIPPKRLAQLLAYWGIDMTSMCKTGRTVQEQQRDRDERLPWSKEYLRRRRLHIPEDATHFVFAHQQEQWDAKDIKDLDKFKQNSGEISLASFGGFIYLKAQQLQGDEVTAATVVGVSALSMTSEEFVGGTVRRKDDRVSAPVASPELWDDTSDVGLESDIYSFGIVMWEVITRRQAWHWVTPAPGPIWLERKQMQISDRVCERLVRPRMPVGLHPEVAKIVRKCLHHDPSWRPDAKWLTNWLGEWLDRLGKSMKAQQGIKISEQSEKRRAETGIAAAAREWAVVDLSVAKAAACWRRGLFSLHHIQNIEVDIPGSKGKQEAFELTLNPQTHDDWEEHVMGCDVTQAAAAAAVTAPEIVKLQPLGIKVEHGFDCEVAAIEKKTKPGKAGKRTLAPYFPEITRGCTLLSINDQPCTVMATFSEEVKTGIIFGGNREATAWKPYVKRIDAETPAAQVEGLVEGAKVLSINGQSVHGMSYQTAKDEHMQNRPLVMTFQSSFARSPAGAAAFRSLFDHPEVMNDPSAAAMMQVRFDGTVPLKLRFSPFKSDKHALVSSWPST